MLNGGMLMLHYIFLLYSSFQKKSNDTNCRCKLQLKQFMHQLNIKVGVLGL